MDDNLLPEDYIGIGFLTGLTLYVLALIVKDIRRIIDSLKKEGNNDNGR